MTESLLIFPLVGLIGVATAVFRAPAGERRLIAAAMLCGLAMAAAASVVPGFAVLSARMGSVSAALGWFRFRAEECSFAAGCAGFVLGVRFAGGRTMTERLTPLGCAMIALLRLAELRQPPAGLGPVWEAGPVALFPLIAADGYGDPCLVVCTLEAVAAAVCCAAAAVRVKRGQPALRRAVCRLAAWQIFFENLLTAAPMIGFVRTEQVVCLLVLLCAAVPGRDRRQMPAAWGSFAALLAMGLAQGALQFAMDKPYLIAEAFARSDQGFDRIASAVPGTCHLLAAALSAAMGETALRAKKNGGATQ